MLCYIMLHNQPPEESFFFSHENVYRNIRGHKVVEERRKYWDQKPWAGTWKGAGSGGPSDRQRGGG